MIPLVANAAWFASCLPEAMAFDRATHNVARAQQEVLRAITQSSGRYRGIRDVREFQDCVPLSDEPGVTGEPVLHSVPTSGTTGAVKFIPYTASLLRQFQRGIAPWVCDLFRHNPTMLLGRSYWAISPVAQESEAFADDTAYLGSSGRWVRSVLAVPPEVRHIRDVPDWRRETLRHLRECRNLTFISVWHPSFLTLLLEGVPDPARLWPKLRVISCWADAMAAQPAAELAALFPKVEIQPKGLIATEGFVTLPLWSKSGAALALRTHFFEFLDRHGVPRLAQEIEHGSDYSVVLTTAGGLYRYRLHDRVRVTGFENECPLLRFLGKEDHVSDWCGEKITEDLVRTALARVPARFVLVACETNAYTVFIEPSSETPTDLNALASLLEDCLQQNVHYRYCRSLGQLQEARVFRIQEGAFARYLEECHRHGQRLGDVKPMLLRRDSGWAKVFDGAFVERQKRVLRDR